MTTEDLRKLEEKILSPQDGEPVSFCPQYDGKSEEEIEKLTWHHNVSLVKGTFWRRSSDYATIYKSGLKEMKIEPSDLLNYNAEQMEQLIIDNKEAVKRMYQRIHDNLRKR